VGYTFFDVAQCHASSKAATSIVKFLTTHHTGSAAQTVQTNNGLVSVANTSAAPWITTVENNILANGSGWITDIENHTACAGLEAR
jgi:hypothetical protein